MNQELPDPNNRPIVGPKSKGFALVITLALVSFVFLLVISLISQVRMDLAYSDVRQDHILAKAHARMGMMIAIGEIQKHLGPDTRVTSTADLYDDRIESEKDYRVSGYPLPSTNLEEVNLYESGKTNKIELVSDNGLVCGRIGVAGQRPNCPLRRFLKIEMMAKP